MIIFTGGKTAGHIYPLLELIKKQDKNNVIYIGLKNSLEEELCAKEEISFFGIELKKKTDYYTAYKRIKELDFDLVVSTGGFVSFPALLVAKRKKKQYILLEENIVFGLTNKLFSLQAYKVCLAFPMKKMKKNYVHTYNPVVSRTHDSKKYPKEMYRILIIGGSLGSKVMCDIAEKIYLSKRENEEVVVVSKNHKPKIKGIKYYSYVDDLPSLIDSSDFIISRAGGGSICEILGMNKRCLLIPSNETKGNHQIKNAIYAASTGACSYLLEEEFTVAKFRKIKNQKIQMSTSIVKYNSVDIITKYIDEVLNNGNS